MVDGLGSDIIDRLNHTSLDEPEVVIDYRNYSGEHQMPDIMKLIQKDLSEPYSIYTYRYFIHNWPHLCYLVCSIMS